MDKDKFINDILYKLGQLTAEMDKLVNKFIIGQIRIKKLEENYPDKIILKPSEETFLSKKKVEEKIKTLLLRVHDKQAKEQLIKLLNEINNYCF